MDEMYTWQTALTTYRKVLATEDQKEPKSAYGFGYWHAYTQKAFAIPDSFLDHGAYTLGFMHGGEDLQKEYDRTLLIAY